MLVLAKAVGLLVTPPGIIILLAVAGLLLQWRWRYAGVALVWLATLALLALSLSVTGKHLMGTLEASVGALPPEIDLQKRAGAIVVLGGGRYSNAPEYGGDTVSEATLVRLRYGAQLHRATGVPLLVTGGSVFGEAVAEGELMQRTLTQEFHTPAKWVEARSRNTYENAIYTRAILEAAGIRRIALVTHAWHMPRAVWAFEQAGFDVLPAPTAFTERGQTTRVLAFLPSIRGLLLSSRALQEHVGLLWYRLAYGDKAPETRPQARDTLRTESAVPA